MINVFGAEYYSLQSGMFLCRIFTFTELEIDALMDVSILEEVDILFLLFNVYIVFLPLIMICSFETLCPEHFPYYPISYLKRKIFFVVMPTDIIDFGKLQFPFFYIFV